MIAKRLLLPAVFVAGVVFLSGLVSCHKSNSGSSSSNGAVAATINGTAFTAQSNQVGGSYLSALQQIYVVGYNIQNKDTVGIQLSFPYIPPVNYSFSTDSLVYTEVVYIDQDKEYSAYFQNGASHAVITLSAADTVGHKVAGSFSGVLYNSLNSNDSVTITNGTFSSYYTLQ